MALKRIMPCLLYDGRSLVKTVKFKSPNYIGDPINAIKIFNDKEVDEIVFLNINASKAKVSINFKEIAKFASESFMPFSYGGGVRSLDDFRKLFSIGIEKVIVNSLLFIDPTEVKKAINEFGSQSVIASIDVKKNLLGKKKIYSHAGYKVSYELNNYIKFLENDIKVGEILITSVDQEGTWQGFDKELIKQVISTCKVPVIANGGAGSIENLKEVLYETNAGAAALGSMAVYQKKGMGVLIGFPKREKVIKDEFTTF